METEKGRKPEKPVELRSEEVQEIMGQIPAWIIRWGITVLFIVLGVLLIGSCFFKYPDVITAQMTLTSPNPAVQIVARTSGRLSRLYVSDGAPVSAGSALAIIENPASTEAVIQLKVRLNATALSPDSALGGFLPDDAWVLGEVQTDYIAFLRTLHDYANYRELAYYPKKIAAVEGQIAKYRLYLDNLIRQREVTASQYQLAGKQYARDSLLFRREVISASEHETSRSEWLQSRYTLEGADASLNNLKIQIGTLEESLLDLKLEQSEKENQLMQDYRRSLEQLQNAIHSWELNYRLVSPIAGQVTFTKYWHENQYIPAGETVFSVVPTGKEALLGVATLPIQRSGKVKKGQRVIIRFVNYPDQEFGIVNGVVSSLSLVPDENNYRVEIALPEGLMTNYKRKLPVSQEMQATAEIVTEDLRLIERFFLPVKKVVKEGFEE